MLQKNALVLYKQQPAVIIEIGEKYTIRYNASSSSSKKTQYTEVKVRDKDIKLLSNGPADLGKITTFCSDYNDSIKETWDLLSSDPETATQEISFTELISFIVGEIQPEDVWNFYSQLLNSFYFRQIENSSLTLNFIPRTEDEIKTIQKKIYDKEHETEIREEFLKRLAKKELILPNDAKYMQEVEALALGKSSKSKIMKDSGITETPEKAHKLLLDTGIWKLYKNPHPTRHGLSTQSATEQLQPPPQEERIDVPGISYAIDNAWSADPDDAVSFDGTYLWVHIADPAATVKPNSIIDIAARNRGSTLYIPEGASRMLCEQSLSDYALGLKKEKSTALSFRIKLDENGAIEDVGVFKTFVTVKCITYDEADEKKDMPELAPLFAIAERNVKRRTNAGAVFIDLPEVHINVDLSSDNPDISITPVQKKLSAIMVREMMLLAGEAAARFAFKNCIPFPFVSQDTPDIPKDLPEGLAGQYRLRRSMRSRSVGITPSQHAGLGIGMYSQVTSPLRRYSDLIAHQQLRAFISSEELIDKDEMLTRIGAGDAASSATIKAERQSNMHWILVYLTQHPEWTGDGVVVELKGKQSVVLIPELAQETLITTKTVHQLNDIIILKAGNINIPELSVTFFEV